MRIGSVMPVTPRRMAIGRTNLSCYVAWLTPDDRGDESNTAAVRPCDMSVVTVTVTSPTSLIVVGMALGGTAC